ncbi:hypothetical protein [Corynebacterium sp.]|uniref:hypothetical protein n=1 Tax=Corynebacterium sp. TaxID=1720 RepID=UPI0026DBFF18|nr:hypothetical protein [Corynebacterium sp.]MDO5032668.1 hypothetical protein [Corynebacterium sp.]
MKLATCTLFIASVLACTSCASLGLESGHSQASAGKAMERDLFRTLAENYEDKGAEKQDIDLRDIYGPELKRFAVQCDYGVPSMTARDLDVPEPVLTQAGLRDFSQVNNETIAALILDFGEEHYEITEWDYRSILWCRPSTHGWHEDLTVEFGLWGYSDRREAPVFQAHLGE